MKKQILLASTLIFIAVLSACGSQTTQTLPAPVTFTEAPAQPTHTLMPTGTPLSTSTTMPTANTATEAPVGAVSFANDVMPILNNSCNNCHGLQQVKNGLDMTSYDTLMAGSFNDIVIIPGSPNDSLLLKQVLNGKMPKRGPKLTAEQIQTIADWINAGALNN